MFNRTSPDRSTIWAYLTASLKEKKLTDTSKLQAEIVALMKPMASYSNYDEADLKNFVEGFAEAGQAIVARAQKGEDQSHPVAFGFWARVDEETAKSLRNQEFDIVKSGIAALKSGTHPWVVELASQSDTAETFLKTIGTSVFPDEEFRARMKDQNGAVQVVKVSPA